MIKKILYIDMDGVIAGCDSDYSKGKYKEAGFFKSIKPCKDAIKSVKMLFDSGMYDIYFLTKPSWSVIESWSAKRVWIEKYFGELAHKRLILTHNKGLNHGDYLIDDLIDNAKGFNGEFIHFRSSMFPDWDSVLNFLIKDYQKDGYGVMVMTDLQERIKNTLLLSIDSDNPNRVKTRLEAIDFVKEHFVSATIDDTNRAWLSIHKEHPEIWAKGGNIKGNLTEVNAMIKDLKTN